MKISKKIEVKLTNKEKKVIVFGQPETDEEFKQMFKLRNDVYVKKGYIDADYYSDGLDYDEYDKSGKCVYFIAKIDDKLIGAVRLIQDDILPIKKYCFDFQTPQKIERIYNKKLAEVSRLIIIPYDKNIYLPRHIIFWGLLDCVIKYFIDQKIEGGYAFIKAKVNKKFNKINLPLYPIKKYNQKYNQKLLRKYFNDSNDPVIPSYYLTDNMHEYCEFIFSNFFTELSHNQYALKTNRFKQNINYLKLFLGKKKKIS